MARKFSVITTPNPELFDLVEVNPEAELDLTKKHTVVLDRVSESSIRAHLVGHRRLEDTDLSGFMLDSRYGDLQKGRNNATLTQQEIKDGWFFDDEYDGLLANHAWAGHEKDRGY